MTRVCTDCKKSFPLEMFPVYYKTSRRARCPDCLRSYNRASKLKAYDTEKNRAAALSRKYGLSMEAYNEMFVAQHGLCAVCERPEITVNRDGNLRYLAVDHDHNCCSGQLTCGRCIRALLCYKCNCLLGNAQDDVEVLKRAATYLEGFK